jgi:hypothetical protein
MAFASTPSTKVVFYLGDDDDPLNEENRFPPSKNVNQSSRLDTKLANISTNLEQKQPTIMVNMVNMVNIVNIKKKPLRNIYWFPCLYW